MPSTDAVSTRHRRTLWLALACACAIVGLGLLLQSLRLGVYLSHADTGQHAANKRMADLNASLEAFRGDPKSAQQTRPRFRQASTFLGERVKAVAAEHAPWPAGEYERKLTAATKASASFADDVGVFADRVTARADLLSELATDVAGFEKSLRSTKSSADGHEAIKRLQGKLTAAKKRLEALPSSKLAVYSDDEFVNGLDNLSNALSGMDRGIASQNQQQLVISLLALKRALESDWGKALLQPDTSGSAVYQERVEGMRVLAQQATVARADAGRTRSLLAFFGALALLGAGVSGLYALPR